MEPLADDHSNDNEDVPSGVEESVTPAVTAAPKKAAVNLLERLQDFCITHGSKPPTCQHRSQNELGVTSARVYVHVNRVVVVCCCFPVPPFYLCNCCVHCSTVINAVSVLEDANAGITLRLNVPRHGKLTRFCRAVRNEKLTGLS